MARLADLAGDGTNEKLRHTLEDLETEVAIAKSNAERRSTSDGKCFSKLEYEHHFGSLKGWEDLKEAAKSERPPWTMEEFLGPSLGKMISGALKPSIANDDPDWEIAFMRALGLKGSTEIVQQILEAKDVLQKLSEAIFEAARGVASKEAATSAELNDKFAADGGCFEMSFGNKSDFFNGNEVRIGSPNPRILHGLVKDHCQSDDSHVEWTTGNYGITTSSLTEFVLVAWEVINELRSERKPNYPSEWPEKAEKLAVQIQEVQKPDKWPSETINKDHPRNTNRTLNFMEDLVEKNRLLENMNERTLLLEEAIMLRLYTGPLFEKYNAVNRGGSLVGEQNAFMKSKFLQLCGGKDSTNPNRYTTSIFVLTSGLIKTSKLSKAEKVWRGISGGLLPSRFWKPDDSGVKGGVEYAFMSTTTNREVAFRYASGKGAGTILEIQTGMIDKGADLSWISQYPHEAELCFPPLTSMEVTGTRIEGSVLVLALRLNLNLTMGTIEEVVFKRAKIFNDMASAMCSEVKNELVRRRDGHYNAEGEPFLCHYSGAKIKGKRYQKLGDGYSICAEEYEKLDTKHKMPFHLAEAAADWSAHADIAKARGDLVGGLVRAVSVGRSAEWFNDDENFQAAVNAAILMKRQVLASSLEKLELSQLALVKELPAEVGTAGMASLRIGASDYVQQKLPALVNIGSMLQRLDLSNNHLGPDDVTLVAEALTRARCLKELDLSRNSICTGWESGAEGAQKLRWGAKRGPKITVSEDDTRATDVALNPIDGDDGGGRYRNIIANRGFDSGVHKWSIRIRGRGRLLVGVVTSEVDGSWREGRGKGLHQTKQAWSVCPDSESNKDMRKWHAGNGGKTGLPPLPVNGCLEVILDCERHFIGFYVDGSAGSCEALKGNTFDLPKQTTFFPAVAFGGDKQAGASVELCRYSSFGINMKGIHALAAALPDAPNLRSINLLDNDLDKPCATEAMSLLRNAAVSTKCTLRFSREQMIWGDKRGPKIEVSEDGKIASDVADNPKDGDDGGGRYRVILANDGFTSGIWKWKFKILSPCRILAGVVTQQVDGRWREGIGKGLHQIPFAWTICTDTESKGVNKWSAGKSSATGLPSVSVGSLLEMELDCHKHVLTFRVDGSAGNDVSHNANVITDLTSGQTFFPAVAFGGSNIKGAKVELSDAQMLTDVNAF